MEQIGESEAVEFASESLVEPGIDAFPVLAFQIPGVEFAHGGDVLVVGLGGAQRDVAFAEFENLPGARTAIPAG